MMAERKSWAGMRSAGRVRRGRCVRGRSVGVRAWCRWAMSFDSTNLLSAVLLRSPVPRLR